MANTNIQNMHIFLNRNFKNAVQINFDNGIVVVEYEDNTIKKYTTSFKEI